LTNVFCLCHETALQKKGFVRNLLMEKLDRIKDIKLKALYIERKVMNNRPEEMDAAEQELETLRDRFCDENKEFTLHTR